jgi:hypothetical protein
MASFALSPSVTIREIDLTTVIPAVASSEGALAGVFRWGPVDMTALIDSEDILKQRYGGPTNFNSETWFTAASFLDYTTRMYISRAADVTGNNFTKSYVGNSINRVANSGDNFLVLANSSVGNTDGLAEGMIILYSNNAAIPVGAEVASVNSTAVVITDLVSDDVDAAEIVFRENIAYTAVALQSDIAYDPTDVQDWDEQIVKNEKHYEAREANGDSFDSAVLYVGRYPGEMGNSLRVSVCDTNDQWRSNTGLGSNAHFNANATTMLANVGSNTILFTFTPADTANVTNVGIVNAHAQVVLDKMSVGDLVEFGNTRIGLQFLRVTSVSDLAMAGNVFTFTLQMDDEYKLAANLASRWVTRYYEFYRELNNPPQQSNWQLAKGNTAANDELHVVVVDELGKFSGSAGQILEIFPNLSRAIDAKSQENATIYYKNVINQQSKYIWWANDRTTAPSQNAAFLLSSTATKPLNMTMIGGADGPDESAVTFGTLAFAYDKFKSTEDIDISLVMQGKARGEPVTHFSQLGNYIIDNICELRKDCVAFISPDYNDVVHNLYEEVQDVLDFRSTTRGSSYGVMDSGYKYLYDKYNDVYRFVPLNGDIAGLCARTDYTNDPWWSPAGLTRGILKNAIRLAWNPRRAQRDELYKNGVNPVMTRPNLGSLLFGDKTLLPRPSAFDRINVRRLFIVLEKAIATAAEYTLFEFNDDFTRAQFRNLVNPYLRDVKGRRGIYDFLVVCDATNNTPEIIDRNEFVADIYIKPARSINFILLNFVAVRTGVAFSEVVGKF